MRKAWLMGLVMVVGTGCARGPNVDSDLPLRRVVVYRNGVGYFERSGHVESDEVRFKMRARMVGDFLATLAIVQRGGSAVRSASFPLDIEDEQRPEPPNAPNPHFARMMKPWVEPAEDEKDPDELRDVVLRMDGEEHDLAIGYIAETPVWKPSYRLVVRDNGKADLQAWGIVQNLSGEDWSKVKLVLVAGAPLAFQSTLGDPVVPPRPVVTDSGEVIAAVPESTTTLGDAPVDEAPAEPEPEEEKAELEADMADDDGEAMGGFGRGAGGARADAKKKDKAYRPMKPAPAPPPGAAQPTSEGYLSAERSRGPSAPRRANLLASVAIEGGTTRYAIPKPVTVPDESATMVLLLNKTVQGEAVFLFSPDPGVPDSYAHPFRVARFENATKGLLERGPIAVFEAGTFLGQGVMESLPARGTATVPFALERGLAVQRKTESDMEGARIHKIESGTLWIERDSVTKTTYTVKNGTDEPAKLLVKHPRQSDARLHQPPKGTEDNTGTGHALVPANVGKYGKVDLVIDERKPYRFSTSWFSQIADEAVRAYLKHPKRDQAVAGKLEKAWELRGKRQVVADEQNELVAQQRELERAARDTRLDLRALEKITTAAKERAEMTKRLKDYSDKLDKITLRLIELKGELQRLDVLFRDAIRGIKLLDAPKPKSPGNN